MRIHLKSFEKVHVPLDHQRNLVGVINKWIGSSSREDEKKSLYSFSRLFGGKATPGGIFFPKGITMFFSSFHDELLKKIILGIQSDPEMFNGIIVEELTIQSDPSFETTDIFYPGSPILIKRKEENNIRHLIYSDLNASENLRETLQTKMKQVGLEDNTLKIEFVANDPTAKTQLINYHGIKNRASLCPVKISGKNETKAFAWNVGLGNSTGIGFGSIK